MKKLIIIIALAGCMIATAHAQEKPSLRYHEFGIIFSNLDNFGLRYKYGTEKTRLRISLLSLYLNTLQTSYKPNDSTFRKGTGYGAGFRIGVDHSIPLFETFSLLLGGELGVNYVYDKTSIVADGWDPVEQSSWTLTPGISFIFGVNYVIKNHLVLGAEINPTLAYNYSVSKHQKPQEYDEKSERVIFNLATSGAGLYIAYRFGK